MTRQRRQKPTYRSFSLAFPAARVRGCCRSSRRFSSISLSCLCWTSPSPCGPCFACAYLHARCSALAPRGLCSSSMALVFARSCKKEPRRWPHRQVAFCFQLPMSHAQLQHLCQMAASLWTLRTSSDVVCTLGISPGCHGRLPRSTEAHTCAGTAPRAACHGSSPRRHLLCPENNMFQFKAITRIYHVDRCV